MNIILTLLFMIPVAYSHYVIHNVSVYVSKQERDSLKEEALEMFYHAYNSYMNNAYPADELMPLSCSGRFRGNQPSRGNVDEAMGNFSLTLIDSLDTLVLIGNLTEFERAVKLVISDVSFDKDVVVSVFETNIRVLGGLLSAHIFADYFKNQKTNDFFHWYQNDLLNLAVDLGYRLLPAFNTTTGIPYGRVNLKHGITLNYFDRCCDTCTACAGTMILEMAALSRLTGIPVFEEKAHKVMDELWKMRHRTSNLMGSVLNVDSGDWIRKDSGVGAGIDSYYEYCLKAYILLSDEKYLRRFNTHYSAIMTYISQGPMLLDVHMHKPEINSKHFMDALLAFWPGLQVLKGDLKPAIETHEMLYQVMQRYKFIPEAFTPDLQVHWGQHPLRPEFIESTYFLFRATGDHHYLQVGRSVLKALQSYARVPCGFASVSDVRTGIHEDSMDSFVLAETLKYLYLLFAQPSDLLINLDDFIFTTEGHLLPLSISRKTTSTSYSYENSKVDYTDPTSVPENDLRTCAVQTDEAVRVRENVKNIAYDVCTQKPLKRLFTSDFDVLQAASHPEGEVGFLFMQELLHLSKIQIHESDLQLISYTKGDTNIKLTAGPAHFGKMLKGDDKVTGTVGIAEPLTACTRLVNSADLKGKIVIAERGDCTFVDKARQIQAAGAIAGIIVDNNPKSNADGWTLFAMSGDGMEKDLKIAFVFLFAKEAKLLKTAVKEEPQTIVTISQKKDTDLSTGVATQTEIVSTFEKIKETLKELYKQTEMDSSKTCKVGSPQTIRFETVAVPRQITKSQHSVLRIEANTEPLVNDIDNSRAPSTNQRSDKAADDVNDQRYSKSQDVLSPTGNSDQSQTTYDDKRKNMLRHWCEEYHVDSDDCTLNADYDSLPRTSDWAKKLEAYKNYEAMINIGMPKILQPSPKPDTIQNHAHSETGSVADSVAVEVGTKRASETISTAADKKKRKKLKSTDKIEL